jgi:hypothetical protein
MIHRYKFTTIDNKRYQTAVYELPERSFTDRYIISREGDRLDLLATEFYNDPRWWWIIAEANNLGKGSYIVPPGIQIRIPDVMQRDVEDTMSNAQSGR